MAVVTPLTTDVLGENESGSPIEPATRQSSPFGSLSLNNIVSWFDRVINDARARSAPLPIISGFSFELVKGRRHVRKLDFQSWLVILAISLSLLLKVLLIGMNSTLITQDYTNAGAKATNIILMIVFCISIIVYAVGIHAVRTRSTKLTYLFMVCVAVIVSCELLLEALDLSLNFAVQNSQAAQQTLQQLVLMIFLGLVLQICAAVLVYRFWDTLKNSDQEETILKVHRLGLQGETAGISTYDITSKNSPHASVNLDENETDAQMSDSSDDEDITISAL